MVLAVGAPADHGLLVAPGGERQHAPLMTLALEALIVDEAVDCLELGLEMLGEVQIVVEPLPPRLDFENHQEHLPLLTGLDRTCDLSDASRPDNVPGSIAFRRGIW